MDWRTWKLDGQVETIQITDGPEYWEESWRLEETCCHLNSIERLSANVDVKKL